jgi:hypothetical protein
MLQVVPPKPVGVTPLTTSKYQSSKYQARVSHGGKRHFLGLYNSEAEASSAVRAFMSAQGVTRYELLPQDLVDELHPTKNGSTLVWPYRGANTKLWWLCKTCGAEWQARVYTRSSPSQPTGCPACGDIAKGRPLTHLEAKTNLSLRGFDLLQPYTHSDDLLSLRHAACGSVVMTRYRSIVNDGNGCSVCSSTGFKANLPAYIYLLDVPAYGALKLGITNVPTGRLRQHARNFEFDAIKTWGPLDGRKAQQIEKFVLSGWRSISPLPNAHMMRIPGGHETIDADAVVLADVLSTIDALVNPPLVHLSSLSVAPLSTQEASGFVRSWHYSGSAPGGLSYYGLLSDKRLVGVAGVGAGSYPGVAKSVWSLGDSTNTKELRRLVTLNGLEANAGSFFLSRVIKHLDPSVEVLVSFADAGAGHHGGMYQASNFLYLGETSASYHYVNANGFFVHKRKPWDAARIAGRSETEQALLEGLTRVDDPPKHKYAYAVSARARKELQQSALPFPKPAQSASSPL